MLEKNYPFSLTLTGPSPPCSELMVRFDLANPPPPSVMDALNQRVESWLVALKKERGGVLPIRHVDFDQVSPLTVELALYGVSFGDEALETLLDAVSDVAEVVSVEIE